MSEFLYFVRGGQVLAGAVLLILTAIAASLASRSERCRVSAGRLILLTVPIVLIVSVTLLRVGFGAVQLSGVLDWSSDGWQRISYGPYGSQVVLNVLLFVPAGVAWAYVSRRPVTVIVGLCGLSVLVELLQGLAGVGAPDIADVLANALGAMIGAVLGELIGLVVNVFDRRLPVTRRLGTLAFGVILILVLASMAILFGADQRQERTAATLRVMFGDSSIDDLKRWDKAGDLEEKVFFPSGLSVVAEGMIGPNDREVTLRYPANFFGARRCVLVTWQVDDAVIREEAGDVCLRPLG